MTALIIELMPPMHVDAGMNNSNSNSNSNMLSFENVGPTFFLSQRKHESLDYLQPSLYHVYLIR